MAKTIIKSEAQMVLKRVYEALREIEIVEESWELERAKCIMVIERYGKSKSKAIYRKAQEAAIAGDLIEDTLNSIAERKKSILEAFLKVLTLFTGQPDLSEAILKLIKAGGDPNKTHIKDKQMLEDAVAWWQDFCRQSMLMARERYIRSKNQQ